ncbi:protein-disulfide reductase DsbD [Pseudochrobactrum sp. sp1633]|uniref:protein-disulfide reductase DsbD n=1 Tax=Pseudochrobactrum sp. sp1633 TaxID=3036706 RepID=UPI0025A4ED24|nr:protein-disulfide reductase DsbD [Pseudochrobactrum sp. sp1633]MDM8346389.1 protein-disulfide reductase DsbD [Pseudochrobactrum sp. sp1633]HWD14226.1 protein-disulfide reductase DsbD [Pseudochrobactrum sp.]
MLRYFHRQLFSFVFLSAFLSVVLTAAFLATPQAQAQSVRSVEEVMQLTVARDANNALQLQWNIAPKIYMYRDKIQVEKPDGTLLPADVTEGIIKEDMNFGSTEVLYNRAFAQVADSALPKDGHVLIRYQGCEEDSICYPPVTKSLDLQTLEISKVALGFGGLGQADLPVADLSLGDTSFAETSTPPAETGFVASLTDVSAEEVSTWLASNFTLMLAAFFGFGLLLALTPCVFPMIPILSGMLARSGEKLSAGRGFVLSSAYVVAMAAAYALLGFAASWSGYNLQAALQTPYALGFMALIFVALAFSMFGYYELQLPQAWTNYFSRRTSAKGGAITGALLLGFGSALIVGPCVTPPLAAALLYVAQTGDAVRGASALFALGLGMGVPLIIFGTFGAKFLPKSGPWLNTIKQIFGVVFLGLAIYMVLRLLSDENAMLLLAVTALACGVFLGVFDRLSTKSTPLMRVEKTTGIVALIYGTLLLVGFAGGSTDPWQPLGFLQGNATQIAQGTPVQQAKIVKTTTEYDLAMSEAVATGKPVLVDFTADWCVTCKANEKLMKKPEYAARLGNLTLIKADITEYSDASRDLMQRFNVAGPPTLMFLEAQTAKEQTHNRVIGELTSAKLNDRLQALGL